MRYGVKDNKKVKRSRSELNWLYDQMPSTKGCLEHINKPKESGGCGGWCCQEQYVSCWYVEFLNSWNHISHNWDDEMLMALVERALRTYLFPRQNTGCVFWNKETKLCGQWESRPYNCRVYGVVPEEEFNERLVRLKVIYPEAKPQCNLVSTESGKPVTKEDTKRWWERLKGIEAGAGVPAHLMHDEFGGSYRTYHDHILMHLFEDNMMAQLSEIRIYGNPMEKESCIRNVLQSMKDFAQKKQENKKYDASAADTLA